MKGISFVKKFIISNWFLAGIPAVLFILFLPSLGTNSRLQIEPVDKAFARYAYEDLNSDSISEVISSGKGIPYFYLLISDNNRRVYDQWNFSDSLDPDLSGFFLGNYDNDRYKEIYIFTYKDDSLFLNINEFFDTPGIKADRIYITMIKVVNKKVTSIVYPAGFFDKNGDGKGELFFSIQTGFGVEPRKLYSFDIVNRVLKSSAQAGVICQKTRMTDADGDGRQEIFGLIGASGNYKTKIPYSDRSSWMMVYDDDLKLKFPPAEFPGLTNVLDINSYSNSRFSGYLASHNTGSADSTVTKPRIILFSKDGKILRDKIFSDLGLNSYTYLTVLKNKTTDRIYLFGTDILELNDRFEVINRVKSPIFSNFGPYICDVDFDGEDEFILFSASEKKLVLYSASLKKIAEANLIGNDVALKLSHYSSKDHENKIFLNAGDYGYFLKLKRNNYYYLGYLVYPSIYFLFFLFIILVKRINTYQVVQREILNRRLVTLQLQGIKSQLDPHFTFNTLNSIASLIYLEDRQLAYDYMNKFTHLLRSLLNDAERIYRSLGEELEFVTTYLDLEKLRFGDKFNYEITIAENITRQEQVPKLVLQTFAENSIKHGIMSLAEGGLLKIAAVLNEEYLILSIEDNGIGRTKAKGLSLSTGKGLRLTGEFYDILNQINKNPIKHFIIDLYDPYGYAVGTRVEVWVPRE